MSDRWNAAGLVAFFGALVLTQDVPEWAILAVIGAVAAAAIWAAIGDRRRKA